FRRSSGGAINVSVLSTLRNDNGFGSRHSSYVLAEHGLDELIASATEPGHESASAQRFERAQYLGSGHRRCRIRPEQNGALRDARRDQLQVLLLSELRPVERERPLQLAKRLFVCDGEKVRGDDTLCGVAHQVVERGADLHGVLRMTAGRVEQPVDARVVDGDLLLGELLAQVRQPVVWRDAKAMPARLREIDRHRESVEGAALLAEKLLEDPFLRA